MGKEGVEYGASPYPQEKPIMAFSRPRKKSRVVASPTPRRGSHMWGVKNKKIFGRDYIRINQIMIINLIFL